MHAWHSSLLLRLCSLLLWLCSLLRRLRLHKLLLDLRGRLLPLLRLYLLLLSPRLRARLVLRLRTDRHLLL